MELTKGEGNECLPAVNKVFKKLLKKNCYFLINSRLNYINFAPAFLKVKEINRGNNNIKLSKKN